MSIQPVNKAAEHLINSTPVLGKKAVNAYLIKNSKGEGEGRKKEEEGKLSQVVRRTGRSCMGV